MSTFSNPNEADSPKQATAAKKSSKPFSLNELQSAHRLRILVADDNEDMRNLLTHYLTQEGYVVQTVTNGRDALASLDEFAPDLLCIDYLMPGMDGQQLARQIRSRHDMLYVPIVMLTAVSGLEHLKLESLESGVDAFLTKPLKREELKVTIHTMLRFKQAQDNMLAALERVSEVQEELLEYERQRGQFEAMQELVRDFNQKLTIPINSAEAIAQFVQQLLQQPTTDNPSDTNDLKTDVNRYLQQLQQLLNSAKESLSELRERSQQSAEQFWQQKS